MEKNKEQQGRDDSMKHSVYPPEEMELKMNILEWMVSSTLVRLQSCGKDGLVNC